VLTPSYGAVTDNIDRILQSGFFTNTEPEDGKQRETHPARKERKRANGSSSLWRGPSANTRLEARTKLNERGPCPQGGERESVGWTSIQSGLAQHYPPPAVPPSSLSREHFSRLFDRACVKTQVLRFIEGLRRGVMACGSSVCL
jgi:hypothetical protein